MGRVLRLCLVLGVVMSVSDLAHADRREEAHAAEARAESAFRNKTYDKALAEYQESYKKSPKPYLLFHIGECYRMLGKSVDAVATYKKYVAKVSKGPDRKKAVEYIAELDIKPADKPAVAPVVSDAPAPQAQDTEAPPVTAEEIAKRHREEEERRKKGIPDNAVLAAPSDKDPLPPGFDPKNLVTDPHDPKVAPPPDHFYPVGYKKPTYKKAWPWVILGVGVAAGVGIGCGLAFGLPKFNSELPIGGPGAHNSASSQHVLSIHF